MIYMVWDFAYTVPTLTLPFHNSISPPTLVWIIPLISSRVTGRIYTFISVRKSTWSDNDQV